MTRLIQANLHYLQQAAELVDRLEDGSYVRCEPMFYNSSIGGHIRHCLEHYEAFTQGAPEGNIDYDDRSRDVDVENRTEAASERINKIITALQLFSELDSKKNIQIKVDCGDHGKGDDLSTQWQTSTIGRELQFLVSHSVHHFAMISGICQRGGEMLDGDFGMAPSTIHYREKLNRI